ncbi:molybdopterin molybdotransferase MoeA [Mucilaginibacter sp. KACC 22063]|uniref:molybdopterin molybdotransferase MoeA n=1 Tax=Mucilaginibacter sp. KACC 22063 TaxID=3025666 RepID=UPI002366481D|nr:molybdopterin molybdotransferase MoeA [Mucilaginibacter sp. KACC 22063]WDF56918.1 molybdopterin molybdotransferase MoeA [Mucilaginibacter sp. KACC 22063]
MISVAKALQLINMQVRDFGAHDVDLLNANGRILAQDVSADRDYPPFNRVTMDGIAISSEAFKTGKREFKIEGIQAAGQEQQTLKDPLNCLEVMTGAMLPIGCDAVIQYELCEITSGIAKVQSDVITVFQNIHPQGNDSKQGDILIKSDTTITPAITGLLAAAGLTKVRVKRLPTVAVCATGDELVEIDQQPLPHQIRQSNSYMLLAELQQEGIEAQRYHIADDPQTMLAQLSTLVQSNDVIMLSGAVSKGKFDHLPNVLKQLGMQTIFHGITQRPGKPFLFGVMPNEALVFAFPGNPISTFVCYQLYFREWLYACIGKKQKTAKAFLSRPVSFKPQLTYHMLVTLSFEAGLLKASPISNSTSGDLISLAHTEAIVSFPADRQEFGTDEPFDLLLLN